MLKAYHKSYEQGKPLNPVIFLLDSGKATYFAPLLMDNVCLKCHGEPGKTMDQEVADAIKEIYPNDKATGYKLGEVRGMWHIVFLLRPAQNPFPQLSP